jgi:hypothetical protein
MSHVDAAWKDAPNSARAIDGHVLAAVLTVALHR